VIKYPIKRKNGRGKYHESEEAEKNLFRVLIFEYTDAGENKG